MLCVCCLLVVCELFVDDCLVVVVRGFLSVVCCVCLLMAARCFMLLYAVSFCVLFIDCCLLFGVCCLLCVVRLCVVCCVRFAVFVC